MSINTALEHNHNYSSANDGETAYETILELLPKNTVPAPAIWFSYDEELYAGDIVCFYDSIRDRDGFGTLEETFEKDGRIYARIIEIKIWTRRSKWYEGVYYQTGDMYEEITEVPVERVALADEVLSDDDTFYCVNYNEAVS